MNEVEQIRNKVNDLIAALYGNHARGVIETQVRFEDGRSGWLRADLAIEAARTVAMEVAA